MPDPLVTAIVSTYASERFLRGCLDDLLAQTLGHALEILVIDACSPEGEGDIVREYQRRHANVRYLRTAARERISVTFNRATGLARGRYLTTANADDRHRPDALARMAAVLEQHPEFGLVYADSLITHRPNESWASNTAVQKYAWPDFTLPTSLGCCLFGAQPLWRKAAHAVAGDWDPDLVRANDQDLFVRIAWKCGAVHLRETLGLFLMRPDSTSGAENGEATLREVLAVLRRFRATIPLEDLFPALCTAGDSLARAAAWFELGNLCALGPYTDAEFALACYRKALDVPVTPAAAGMVRAAYANNSACILTCAGAAGPAGKAWQLAGSLPAAAHNRRLVAAAQAERRALRLRDLTFVQVEHAVVAASRAARSLTIDAAGRTRWSPAHEQLPWDVFEGPNGVPITAADAAPVVAGMAPRPPAEPAARPRHVGIVMYGWADSGGGTMLPRRFAKALAARGTRVTVFAAAAQPAPELPDYAVRATVEDGVHLFSLCNRPSRFMDLHAPEREIDDPAVRSQFAQLLDDQRPDVVHFWNLHNLGMSLPGECRARGIPTVLTSNNYWALCPRLYLIGERLQRCSGPSPDGSKCEACLGTPGSARAQAARRGEGIRMLRQDIDVHLAVSQRVRDLYVHNGDDPGHVRVLHQEPPGVQDLWHRVGRDRRIVDRLARPLRVGFLGSVMAHKGVHVLAAALQHLPAGAVECVALGDVAPGYAEVLQAFDRRGALHLFGAYAEQQLPELLARFDVMVVPSVWDDCAPFVVAEALAARCPVVGSAIGGIPDFVEHGRNGLLFAAGDAAALAECLLSFQRDPAQLGRMQRAIVAPRGLEAFVDDVMAVYEPLLRARAPAPHPASTACGA